MLCQLSQCMLLRREPENPCDEHAVAVLKEERLLAIAMYLTLQLGIYILKKGNKQRLPGSYWLKSEQRGWLCALYS